MEKSMRKIKSEAMPELDQNQNSKATTNYGLHFIIY